LGGDAGEVLRGGKGHDSINGGDGNDLIYGGQGNDTLAGGDGVDFFIFEAASGTDIVTGFQAGTDKLFISSNANGNGIFTAEQVLAAAMNNGGNVVIDLGGSNSITLQGVAVAELTVADFAVA
ncbi:MAG: bifunctional metallophosphatase/5'-nucleotidase, partial [Alphaproteobacteria bacterium]|nr:bifunctional metallophosphatase/5'-nucleotidase [Alphaproteobacteria bacterium]